MPVGEVLQPKPKVDFDPENIEHLKAYKMLMLDGKQHQSLRFTIIPSIDQSVPQMMTRVLTNYFLKKLEFV